MSVYLVTGPLPYRWSKPGERFEATLDAETEARAIAREAIRVIDKSEPALAEGSWFLPARSFPKEQ